MKRKSSCQSCRQRHRRCITQPRAIRCNGCDELGQECIFSPEFQFRPWKRATRGKPAHGESRISSTEDHVAFDDSSIGDSIPVQVPPLSVEASDGTRSSITEVTSPQESSGSPSSLFRDIISVPNADDNLENPRPQRQIERGPASLISLESQDITVARQSRISFALEPPKARSTSGLTQREAFLFSTWVQNISLISDAVDDARHFGVIVSRLALDHPVLLNGILALASRFDALATGVDSDMENTYYHGRCIELLIGLLSKPADTYDSTLLAAVVMSRLYEENDTETDALTYHLNGTRTLLSNEVITRLATQVGLAEAACWIHLRQAIYIAIVHRQHLDIPLGVYKELTAFRGSDDTSYANRAVYLLAQVLLEFFPNTKDSNSPRGQTWDSLEQGLETWMEGKPSSFEPLYYEAPDVDAEKPFPSMWMVSTVQTVALQYYFASKIVLCLRNHDGSTEYSGFEIARMRKHNEKTMASYLCTLMGLALSNKQAPNAWYLPCHMLHLCGYCIRSSVERVHTIQYLKTVKQEIQWKTAPVIAALNHQWAELDSYEG